MSLYIWKGRKSVGVGIEATELTVEVCTEMPSGLALQGAMHAEGNITLEDYAEGDGEPFKKLWHASTNYLKDDPGDWKVYEKREGGGLLVSHQGEAIGLFRIDNNIPTDLYTSQWLQRFIALRLCDYVVRSHPSIPTIVVEEKDD